MKVLLSLPRSALRGPQSHYSNVSPFGMVKQKCFKCELKCIKTYATSTWNIEIMAARDDSCLPTTITRNNSFRMIGKKRNAVALLMLRRPKIACG